MPLERGWIYVEEQRGRASLRRGFWIEDVRRAKGQVEGLGAIWVLVQEIAQVRGGLMGCGDRQEHDVRPLAAEYVVLGALMDIFKWKIYLLGGQFPNPIKGR